MHNYDSTHGSLPPHAIYGKDGKPLLSWRVLILPYIEEQALYEQFHLDEPWDSPHNEPLLRQIPRCYRSPLDGGSAEGLTNVPSRRELRASDRRPHRRQALEPSDPFDRNSALLNAIANDCAGRCRLVRSPGSWHRCPCSPL